MLCRHQASEAKKEPSPRSYLGLLLNFSSLINAIFKRAILCHNRVELHIGGRMEEKFNNGSIKSSFSSFRQIISLISSNENFSTKFWFTVATFEWRGESKEWEDARTRRIMNDAEWIWQALTWFTTKSTSIINDNRFSRIQNVCRTWPYWFVSAHLKRDDSKN